jgi:hypothetical protein
LELENYIFTFTDTKKPVFEKEEEEMDVIKRPIDNIVKTDNFKLSEEKIYF